MNDLSGKKLIILGGNWETGKLVQEANTLGVYTIVVDPNPDAPAKKFAAEHHELDGYDIDGIVKLAVQRQVDGVLVGVADVLVSPYQQICERLHLPCYASRSSASAFSGKDGFKEACQRYGVQDIPGILVDSPLTPDQLDDIVFPVMVKPVDNGGGVGMRNCHEPADLNECIKFSLSHSKTSKLLVERYMTGDDMFAYYTFKDGKACLTATADRITSKSQGDLSPVCIAAKYPSRHTTEFLKIVHPELLKMFEGIGVQNGVLNIQFFVQDGSFFAYDPGFRLQGEAPHIYLQAIYGFDHRKMLIHFALTGTMDSVEFEGRDTYDFKDQFAGTFWVLLKSGRIHKISGMETISKDSSVISVIQRLDEGDRVEDRMVGTERQVLARIYVLAPTLQDLRHKSEQLQSQLKVFDDLGNDMVLDWVNPKSFV